MQPSSAKSLPGKNPIKAALSLVRSADLSAVDAHVRALEALEDRINALKAVSGRLLTVETAARNEANKQVFALEKERDTLRDSPEAAALVQAFPEFSLEPFRWRDDDGFPRLAAFSLDGAEFKIAVKAPMYSELRISNYEVAIAPMLPADIVATYCDVVGAIIGTHLTRRKQIKEEADGGNKTLFISAAWSGVIPVEVRSRIAAFSRRFKSVLMVAEVEGWKYGEIAEPKPVDPLIVGWDGEKLRLIASFDQTTVEAAARDYLKKT